MIAHANLSTAPYDVVMEVTPQLASKWLEGNTHNRPLNQAHVERLAGDMKAGRWKLTHQGLAFDTQRVLLDGQHRLWAVIEANVSVRFRVFFNEPTESRGALDTGIRRSNLDIFSLTGQFGDVTNRHLATMRAMLAGRSAHSVCRSSGEEAVQYDRHRLAISFAIEHLGSCGHKGITTAQIRAVIARAYYFVDHKRLAHFCDVLKSGVPADESDYVVLALRDFLMRSHTAGLGESAQRLRYSKTQWALRQFLDGRTPKRLFGSELELFPLPAESVTAPAKSA